MVNYNSILKLRNFILHFIAVNSVSKSSNKNFSILTINEYDNKVIKTINYFTHTQNGELVKLDVIPKKHQLIGILTFQKDGLVLYKNIIKDKLIQMNSYIESLIKFVINEFNKLSIEVTKDDLKFGSLYTENDSTDIIRSSKSDTCLVY